MKIALLLSGFLRTFDENYASLKENLLDRFDTDIYITTWNINEPQYESFNVNKIVNLYGNDLKGLSVKDYNIYEKFKNRMVIFDDMSNLIKTLSKDKITTDKCILEHGTYWVERLKDQWLLVNENYNQIIVPEHYDIIVRSRFDISYNRPFTFTSNDNFTIPENPYHGYTDHLAYGSPIVMKKYCQLYQHIQSLYENFHIDISFAEGMLRYYMEEYNEKIHTNTISNGFYQLNKR